MSENQNSLQGDGVEQIWGPCRRATRLYIRTFDHGSHVQGANVLATASYKGASGKATFIPVR